MEITLQRLLEGKPTIIKGQEYKATKEYVEPFINEMSKYTDKFIINVIEPSQIILSSNDMDTTYNRVWIQAIMPDSHDICGLHEIYHFVYGFDVRTPVYKVFRSYGPCVFNTEWLTVNKLEAELPSYSIKTLMEYTNDIESKVNKMKSTFLDSNDRHRLLGELIEKSMLYTYQHVGGKVKLSPATVIKAFENVYMDSSSDFYIKETEECSVWNYYSAFIDLIKDDTKKDLMSFFEKNFLVGLLFNKLIECK